MYTGQLRQNQRHGVGKMEVVEQSAAKTSKTVFDGQWKCDKVSANKMSGFPIKRIFFQVQVKVGSFRNVSQVATHNFN